MSFSNNKIFSFISASFKNSRASLSTDEKIEVRKKIERSNLKNATFLNFAVIAITLLLFILDIIIFIDISKQLYPSHKYVFMMHVGTLPLLLIPSYLIYHFNFKIPKTEIKHYKLLITINVLVYFIISGCYNYLELTDFNVGSTLIISILVIGILFRFSIKTEFIIALIFAIIYYTILNVLGINFENTPLVYVNGVVSIFLYLLLATIISKQTEQRFIAEVQLKRKNIELSSKNEELNKSRTKIEKQNDLLVESNEKLSRFAFMAAHDLKGPLRTTQNLLDILYSKYNLTFDEEDKPLIQHIMKSSKDLSNLINNLLLFSSLTQKLPKTEIIDIQETIKNVTDSLQTQITSKNVELIIANELNTIKANPDLIYQLFLNIINNGIKFSQHSDNKKILIESKKIANNKIEYKIQDFGIGIPEEKQAKIFDMFYKGHSKVEYSGSGIGLSICKKIVEFYNGEIWLESQPNIGSTFFFTLSIEN